MNGLSVLDVLRVGSEAICLYNDIKSKEKAEAFLSRATIINKTLLVGVSIIGVAAGVRGSAPAQLGVIKSFEMILRTVDLPLSILNVIESDEKALVKFEQGVLPPLAAMARAAAEMEMYKALDILSWSPEKQAAYRVPVYAVDIDPDYCHFEQIGEKPLDLEEVRKIAQGYPQALQKIKMAEIVFRSALITKTITKTLEFARRSASIQFKEPVGEHFPRCAITKQPIKHLMVPNRASNKDKVYYDKNSIEKWIAEQPMNPPPQWPLNEVPLPLSLHSIKAGSPAMQGFIDDEWRKAQSK